MDIDTLDGFLNLISDNDIFEGDGFYKVLVKITNYPNIQKSISLLAKMLPYVDLNKKIYKVRYEEDWPIEIFYEKTFDEVNYDGGDWDSFNYNFKGSIFTKIYFDSIGYDILRLLFESGANPNNINTLLYMMIYDFNQDPDTLKHKNDLVDILLENGASPQYLLDYLIANDNNDYCTEVIDYLKLIISKRLLAFAKTQNMVRDMTGRDLEPSIFQNISKHMRQKGSGKKKKSTKKKK